MSKQRKFNARRFFDGFHGHEGELAGLFSAFGLPVPDPITAENAAIAARERSGISDLLNNLLFQLDDLATKKGRDIVMSTADSFAIQGGRPGTEMTNQRAALWLWNQSCEAFEGAMDRLAAAGVQGGQIALFPGREAQAIADDAAAVAGFAAQLNRNIASWNGAERFIARHYRDGTVLVILVFCERTAEARLEMESGSNVVRTSIGKPVIQDVLFYDQNTGELEIEASHWKQREVLRSSFAVGVMGDDGFFPREEATRVLRLHELVRSGFALPTRSGHTATITSLKLKDAYLPKPINIDLSGNRTDVVAYLRSRRAGAILQESAIKEVRIELVLGPGRLDRKSIALKGDNRIKFNRASHVDTVYGYLRHWQLMQLARVESQTAA